MRLSIRAMLGLFLWSSTTVFADGVLISWSGRVLTGASQASFDAAKTRTVAAILEGNRSVTSWPETYYLALGAKTHHEDRTLLAGLVEQLADTTERKLTDTSRLIVWERIASGDILFEGKGLHISDDLFTVAGRANWLLRTMTERNFGYITPRTSKADIREIQARWRQWLGGLQVADYRSPYETPVKGLEELRSLAALEALIVSLRPSEQKQAATDAYTHSYLAKLTEIQEQHDSTWWDRWWSENASSLEWQPETGKFRAKGAQPSAD